MKKVIFLIMLLILINIVSAVKIHETGWVVKKTGKEEQLDIQVRDLDNNTAAVIIKTDLKYISDVSLSGKDATQIPVSKIDLKVNSYSFSNNYIDLTKDNLFYINYDNKKEVHIKLGWESVEIYSGSAFLTPVSSSNIFIDINNTYHVAWIEGTPDDVYYSKSNDYGQTWDEPTVLTSQVYTDAGITGNLTHIFVYYQDGTFDSFNISQRTLTGSWIHRFSVFDDQGDSTADPSCITNSTGSLHCCFLNTSADTAHYLDLDSGETQDINSNSLDDTDTCDIEVDNNDCVFVVGVGSDLDKIDIWSPCLDGFGDTNRVLVNNSQTFGDTIALAINYYDNSIYIAVKDSGLDLHFCSNTSENRREYNCTEVYNGASAVRANIVSNNHNSIFTSHFDSIFNSSDNGLSWYHNDFDMDELSFGGNNHPYSNRLYDTLHVVFKDGGNDLRYESLDSNNDGQVPNIFNYKSISPSPYDLNEVFYLGSLFPSFNFSTDEPSTCAISSDNATWTFAVGIFNHTSTISLETPVSNISSKIFFRCYDSFLNYAYTSIDTNNSYLYGTVKDDLGGNQENAIVTVLTNGTKDTDTYANTTTNSTGEFTLFVPNGTYTVCAYQPNDNTLRGDCVPSIEVSYG